ncbi:MAG: hypothetical protein ACYCYL_09105 [Acidithiobacillus sp.]
MLLFRRLERLAEGGSGLAVSELAQAIDASLSKGASPHEGFNGAHARAAGIMSVYVLLLLSAVPLLVWVMGFLGSVLPGGQAPLMARLSNSAAGLSLAEDV